MEMYLIALVVAFGAGAFAAAIGAVGAVTLTGLAAFVALLVAPGVGHVDFLGIYAFGLYLGPHVSFAPACAAAAYAGSRGYIVADGKDILSPLIGTGKASPMIVGGIFGVIGYFLNVGLKLVVPGIDTIALTVVLVCLMGKVFGLLPGKLITADQVELLKVDNVVSPEAKAAGRTLEGLGITGRTIEALAPSWMWKFRPAGQFTRKGHA